MQATVTATSPVTILAPGADTTCPADVIDGLALDVDDLVTVEVRTPQVPLITAVEVAA